MSDLRKKLIRLAYEKPELRSEILPLVASKERTKTGASEVDIQDLIAADPWVKSLLRQLAAKGLKTPEAAWSGIHGNIIMFREKEFRFTPDVLKALGSLKNVRWIDFSPHGASVGIEGSWID